MLYNLLVFRCKQVYIISYAVRYYTAGRHPSGRLNSRKCQGEGNFGDYQFFDIFSVRCSRGPIFPRE